ncbi:MAG: preprotein translocase subunit SecG, partial [Planctomycetota bacterium]|nr:preprotein translocase subunit SecG [Planctomycetota bacterium]
MDIFIMTLFIVICLLLIMVILLQKGRGGGLGAMFGGAGSSAFGTRTGDVFTWVTVVLTAMFLLMAIGTTLIFRPKPQTVDVPVFMPPGRSTDDMTSV